LSPSDRGAIIVKKVNMKIKQEMKKLREAKGMSQAALAERLNMARSTYSKMENGNTQITVAILFRLSEIFSVPLETFKGTDAMCFDSILHATQDSLSKLLFRSVPFEDLTEEHHAELKKNNISSKEEYEANPIKGRIYRFGPKDVFRYMMEDCNMMPLFQNNYIKDEYLLNSWNQYLANREVNKILFEIDTREYFTVFIYSLTLKGGELLICQVAERDFPIGIDEFDCLEILMRKLGANEGDILCGGFDGYDSFSRVISKEELLSN
jgi:transcriptional regulator with XRE-family HTH domain